MDGKTPVPTTPGPTIHAKRGTPLTVMQANKLPAVHPFLNYDPWTSTHLHGSASKPQYDGYASDITNVGQTKRYIYPNKQDARTLWYHDHGVHHTAENAYMGLAAQYHLHDDVETGLSIPKWEFGRETFTTDGVAQQFDLPLVLADKMFSANGEFRYDDAGHTGLWGDVVLVNGVPWPNLKVYKRKYRFRVLNASISRGYRLQMSNSAPISVIGTDGGLMPQVQATTQLRIGMAERYEIVIDFSKYTTGTKVQLLNLGVPNSTDFDNTGKIMQFQVVDTPAGAGRRDAAQRRPLLPEPEQGGLGPQGERHPGHHQDRGGPPERRVEDPEHLDQHHEQLGVGQLRRLGLGQLGLGSGGSGSGSGSSVAAPRSS